MNKKSIGIGIIIGIGAALAIGATSGGSNLPSQPSYGDEPGRFVALEWEGGHQINERYGMALVVLDTATGVFCVKQIYGNEKSESQNCSGTFANYGR